MFTAYTNFWKQYIDFKGRTKRSGFWWPFMFNTLIRLTFFLIYLFDLAIPFWNRTQLMEESALSTDGLSMWSDISPVMIIVLVLWLIFELAILVPSLAIGVRRLRDANFHWSLIFLYAGALVLSFIPFVGYISPFLIIASIVLWAFPSREKVAKVNNFYNNPVPNQFVAAQPQAGFNQSTALQQGAFSQQPVQSQPQAPAADQQAAVAPQQPLQPQNQNFQQPNQAMQQAPGFQQVNSFDQSTGFTQPQPQAPFADQQASASQQPLQPQNPNLKQPNQAMQQAPDFQQVNPFDQSTGFAQPQAPVAPQAAPQQPQNPAAPQQPQSQSTLQEFQTGVEQDSQTFNSSNNVPQ
ncbi:DUF805 domain-containing protein [Streptococcus dentapri]|uniref:DUF805 domain-containing protein n=1 Tax=Streptococcus dentapri TaxID=573564 RepID=A0ABV8D360_9STRE